jgi:hypothetical protein
MIEASDMVMSRGENKASEPDELISNSKAVLVQVGRNDYLMRT